VGPARERPRRVPPAALALDVGLVARILSIATDLMLGSKVEAQLTAAGHEVTTAAAIEETTWDGKDLIVADLDAENPEALVGLGIPVLGYYSHVDVATKEAAEAAGIDLAVPRSRMARELPELAAKLLSD
jgi:acetylornithine deacetylase/succinyl-diaminopimelate desuccinylase-like protein